MSDRPEAAVRLPPLPAERAAALLLPPEIPAHAAADVALARAAAGAAVPLLLCAPRHARRLAIARALHAVAHREGPVVVWDGAAPCAELDGAGATIVVDLDALDSRGVLLLEACLDEPAGWLVGLCEDASRIPASLASRLGAVTLTVPPLDARGDDVRALAPAVLAAACARSGRVPPALTDDALEALARRRWPGGRVELEAVLARAMLVAGPGGSIDAASLHLTPPAPAVPSTVRGDGGPAGDGVGPRLEYLLAELAHELRNPLVTVKTFAQQLPALLGDEELRTRFAELTDEAVARMDGLLENVLAFARLPAPRPEDLDVGAVLDRVLDDVGPALDERDVRVRRVGGGARCAADREHLSYALRNLLVGIAQQTPPRQELVLDATANGIVSLQFGTGAAISRLRDLAAADPEAALDDPTFLPLAFTLARAVLERTGGQLGVVPDLGGQAKVTVRLPPAVPTETTR